MESISLLRMVGIGVGLWVTVIAFGRYRARKINRSETLFRWAVGGGLLVVSLFPSSVNFLRSAFALESHTYGRLLALLIVSNLFLWLMIFRERYKTHLLKQNVDQALRLSILNPQVVDQVRKRLDGVSVLVVIPAYNEQANLGRLLERIPERVGASPVGTVVIDDGSSDGTGEVVEMAGGAVVRSPLRRGQGAALRLGYDLARKLNADVVVTMDGDGQHRPEEIEDVVRPILEGEADFVIGSRVLGTRERDSIVRWAGIHLNNVLINFLAGTRATDCSSGFKAIRVSAVDRIDLAEDQFQAAEVLISAAHQGLRIKDVPITVQRRQAGESKKGKNVKYGLSFLRVIFKSWWR